MVDYRKLILKYGLLFFSALTSCAIAEDDAVDMFIANSKKLPAYCCMMEVEILEDVADVNRSKFLSQVFMFTCDDSNRRRRFDHFPEFDSSDDKNIPRSGASCFVFENEKKVVINNGSPRPLFFNTEEVKKSEFKTPFCTPFGSTLMGYSSFAGRSISALVDDELAKLFKRFDVQDREIVGEGEIVEYRVSKEVPVFCKVLHAKNSGGMPTSTETVLRIPGGKPRNLGKAKIEWKRLGDAWVPVSQRSETNSTGGPATEGGYSLVCTVKYRWSFTIPETVWLTGDEKNKFLYPGELRSFISEHEHSFK